MKLGLIQTRGNCQEKNRFDELGKKIRKAAAAGAQVIVLPELFLHEYFPQVENVSQRKLAHTLKRKEIRRLQTLSGDCGVVMVIPFYECSDGGQYYNSCAVFDADGSVLGVYRKIHIPNDPGFYEKFYFTSGNKGFTCFSTKFGRIGVLICWDQWFPEAARLTAMRGCEVVVCPTAIGWDHRELNKLPSREKPLLKKEELTAWKSVQKGHAIANNIYWAAVNRVGRESNLEFWGHSFVYGPFGQELGELGPREEKTLMVECDPEVIRRTRATWTFFRDREPQTYTGLLKDCTGNEKE